MEEEGKSLFSKVVVIVIIVFLLNVFYIFFKYGDVKGFTGFSVKATLDNTSKMPFSSKIYLMVQWGFIFMIVAYAFLRGRMRTEEISDTNNITIDRESNKNKTDLDLLYAILKENKKMKISSVSKTFSVSEEVALEWCKILESGDLASIDYPGFGSPFISIKFHEEPAELKEREEKNIKEEMKVIKGEIEKKSIQKISEPVKSLKIVKRAEEPKKKRRPVLIKKSQKNNLPRQRRGR